MRRNIGPELAARMTHLNEMRASTDAEREAKRTDDEVAQLRVALADAIRRPLGVIPASADKLVTHDDLDAAEKRRTSGDGIRKRCGR